MPSSGVNAPFRTLTIVDLPAPLWPTRPRHSPALTCKVAPSSALTTPKRSRASSTSTRGTGGELVGIDRPSSEKAAVSRETAARASLPGVCDHGLGVFQRVLHVGDPAFLGGL